MYKKVSDLLSVHSDLAQIREHASDIARLQNKLSQKLEPPLNQHVIVANFDAKTLIIHTDSPIWAAKLRFKIPELLDIVKNLCEIPTISTIRIKVVIPKDAQEGSKLNIQPLSLENADYLQQLATTTDDAALADVMARLAKHRKTEENSG